MDTMESPTEGTLLQDMKTRGLNFGEAIEAMRQGDHVAREGWNGKDMRIFLIEGRNVEGEQFRERINNANKAFATEPEITLAPHIDMKAADGVYVTGWLASQTDMLARDWVIVE